MGVEGTVIKKSVYPENIDSSKNRPEITYIWFDNEGNSFTAKFENKKASIIFDAFYFGILKSSPSILNTTPDCLFISLE